MLFHRCFSYHITLSFIAVTISDLHYDCRFVAGSCWRGWSSRRYRSEGTSLNTVFTLQEVSTTFQSQVNSFGYLGTVSCLWPPHREKEALQERGVKLGPMGCRDPKVVQVLQDQMGQRYIETRRTKTLNNIFIWCFTACVIPFRTFLGKSWSSRCCWRARRSRTSGNARRERHTRTFRPKGRCSKLKNTIRFLNFSIIWPFVEQNVCYWFPIYPSLKFWEM